MSDPTCSCQTDIESLRSLIRLLLDQVNHLRTVVDPVFSKCVEATESMVECERLVRETLGGHEERLGDLERSVARLLVVTGQVPTGDQT